VCRDRCRAGDIAKRQARSLENAASRHAALIRTHITSTVLAREPRLA
jgi:hypothetical protein